MKEIVKIEKIIKKSKKIKKLHENMKDREFLAV
jgi:hypothetical protein